MLELEEQLRRLKVEYECLKNLSDSFRARVHSLEQDQRERHEFVRNVAHELRSPLNSTLILADILGRNHDGNLSAKEVGYAETIHESGHLLLLDTINDLIDVAEAGSKSLPLEVSRFEIGSFIEGHFDALEQQIDPDTEAGAEVSTDKTLLRKLLVQVTKSALEFAGETKLGVVVRRINPTGVADLLPAYPGGSVTAIFLSAGAQALGARGWDSEQRIEAIRAMDGDLRGEQLRLYMGMSVAKILAGGLRYSKEVDGSCCFALLIPDLPAGAEFGAKPTSDMVVGTEKLRLLLVEDEKVQLASLCALLERSPETESLQVDTAESADEGKFMLERHQYACMIVDLGLRGGVSGLDFLRALANDGTRIRLPIVVYTGRVMAPELEEELGGLADSIVVKGVDPPEKLLDAVAGCTGADRMAAEAVHVDLAG